MKRRCSVRPLSHYADKMAHRRFPPVWVVIPEPHLQDADTFMVSGLGRRELYLPAGSALCCSWWEAMDYANTGRRQQPVFAVYPEWCGL